MSDAIDLPSTHRGNEGESISKMRKVTPISVIVESLSQMTFATHSENGATVDFSSAENEGASSAGPCGMAFPNSLKTFSFLSNKENVVFYFVGQNELRCSHKG